MTATKKSLISFEKVFVWGNLVLSVFMFSLHPGIRLLVTLGFPSLSIQAVLITGFGRQKRLCSLLRESGASYLISLTSALNSLVRGISRPWDATVIVPSDVPSAVILMNIPSL